MQASPPNPLSTHGEGEPEKTGQTLYEFGGNGAVMHLAVANGFPPQTYTPLLQPFTARYRVVSLPPRPLWHEPPPPESIHSWRSLADDLLAGLRDYDLRDVIAIGHSFGCVASMLAVIEEPNRFRALILLDPTFLPPRLLRLIDVARIFRFDGRQPLVNGALRRRQYFANRDEAFAYWRSKPLFRDWSDDALWLYTDSMTRPAPDGGLRLTWSPEWEARYYRTIFTHSWREIPKLRGLLPTLAIRGTTTNTFAESSARKFRDMLPDADYAEIEGHGHLFPQSAPEETRRLIEGWLEKQSL
jgi:pimeloyl-ACP methyl ester carboxylesterase